MDIEGSEEDQVHQAIAMSLGETKPAPVEEAIKKYSTTNPLSLVSIHFKSSADLLEI